VKKKQRSGDTASACVPVILLRAVQPKKSKGSPKNRDWVKVCICVIVVVGSLSAFEFEQQMIVVGK